MPSPRNGQTRTCEYPDCDATFVCRADSVRKYCEVHTSGAGRKGLGVTKNTWQNAHREKLEDEAAANPLKRELERVMDENTQLRRAIRENRREEDSAERIREEIFKVAAVSPAPPDWLHTPEPGSTSGVPITMWSDWHWDETVYAEQVGGVNEYNQFVQVERLHRLTNTVVDLSLAHMTQPKYPGIVVNLGGDMVTGEIHQELVETNQRPIVLTILDIQNHLAAALKVMADNFGHVFVPCVVGNHGRLTLKPRMKNVVHTSWEWMLYMQLAKYFENDPRIQFFISNETDVLYQVHNERILLTHGDRMGVKGGDGIIGSIGPIKRGAIKIGHSEAQIGRHFDSLVIGHWHQLMPGIQGIWVNGSMKGYDEFARNALRAPFEVAQQLLWFVHPKWGPTARWPIYLQGQAPTAQQREWVSWQTA